MIRAGGFSVAPDAVSLPYLWWSRADLGMAERVLGIMPGPPGQREETLLNAAAVKANPGPGQGDGYFARQMKVVSPATGK